ncbi:MAG: translation initiation factor IF-2 [Buchnera aphidicola (Periphyllus lyropictus)]|uniref:translation initiation factor IF-2 n=1 Tax=Buchnera aphidicola TaxID=9 RepID=UPI001EC03D70|nr:translation initiation factor IF-2 [Buchnera aphidicola]NIH16575.1 translation initiation factor IF-2 [Buchnera aphidicola (Periphyllus lyropictus)]USS94465.1 translation initiation factor IF-2 [Buchnera aphidicola (Periphyllus lyropictus)]
MIKNDFKKNNKNTHIKNKNSKELLNKKNKIFNKSFNLNENIKKNKKNINNSSVLKKNFPNNSRKFNFGNKNKKIIQDNFKNIKKKKKIFNKIYTKNNVSSIKKKNNIFRNNLNRNNKNFLNFKFKKKSNSDTSYLKKNKNKNFNKRINFIQQVFKKPKNSFKKKIEIFDKITVFELSKKMGIKKSILIKKIIEFGIVLSKKNVLEIDLAQLIAEEMGFIVKLIYKNKLKKSILNNPKRKYKKNFIRPPIVTIMGHVDHGKTSLLDCIRKTSVVNKEKGGITQSIGAYHVSFNGKKITFLDTPGHSAFSSMRKRGAEITDIVVLIIAADDGVMPQTIEAIKHAQNSKVPIIVAINKIDKTNINIEKIKNVLMKYNILSEKLGGENIFVNISVKLNKGIDNLLKNILLQSEVLELSVSLKTPAKGIIIESFLDKGKGPVSNIILKKGELKIGDVILCGTEYGKIKSIKNEYNKNLLKVGPSIPVEILGFSGLPISGDILTVIDSEKRARSISIYRKEKQKNKVFSKQKKVSLDNLFENINKKNISELNIILKTNSKGSLEAIFSSIRKLSNKEVKVNIIRANVGRINETDAYLANTSNAIIIGFNVRADLSAKKIIKKENLDLRYYSVIYNLINEIKSSICGLSSPKLKQKIIGLVEVRSIFKSPKFGLIAGCMVTEGIIKRNYPIRILRDHIVIYEGELESIRRFKEDVKEVRKGIECGIGIKNYNDIHVNDIIEVFKVIKI